MARDDAVAVVRTPSAPPRASAPEAARLAHTVRDVTKGCLRLPFAPLFAVACAGLIGSAAVLSLDSSHGTGSRLSSHPGLRPAVSGTKSLPGVRSLLVRGPAGRATLRLYRTPTPASGPTELVGDGHGGYWFTEQGSDGLGHVSPRGDFREYRVLTVHSQPFALALDGRGNVWFTELAAGKIGLVDRDGNVREFSLPSRAAQPYAIARGPAGKMWFTEYGAGTVGSIDPQGRVTEYRLPTKDAAPAGIVWGADGNVWVAESGYGASRLARVTPTGAITEFPLPTRGAEPFGIATSGRMLWVTEFAAGKIASADLAGHITEYGVPSAGAAPFQVTVTAGGQVWFTEPANDQLGEVSLKRGRARIVEYPLPEEGAALDVAPGQDGTVWTTEYLLDSVGAFMPQTGHRRALPLTRPPASSRLVA